MKMRDLPGRIRLSVLVAALAASMSGCVLLLGGAALGGAISATDRRTTAMQLEDTEIETRVSKAFDEHFARKSVHIDVTSYNQKVLIAGQVPSDKDRDYAERLAAVQQDVQSVHNELTIGSLAGLSSQSDDTLLRGKVASALLSVHELPTGVVKTTCTDGTIYLLGRVSAAEAALAERAASHVNGVKRVVALFDLLSAAELEQYQPKPAPAAGDAQTPAAPAPKSR